MASVQDLDPSNPWVKDPSGKHTNVSALLDWPEESDDSDSESKSPTRAVGAAAAAAEGGEAGEDGEGEVMAGAEAPQPVGKSGRFRNSVVPILHVTHY